MIESLLRRFPNESERGSIRVLIPGAGLARLGWEVATLGTYCPLMVYLADYRRRTGFESRCNEFSHYMLLPSYYILNK